MTIGTPVGFGNTSGAGTSTPATVTLPVFDDTQPGVLLVLVTDNSGVGSEAAPTGGSGGAWTSLGQLNTSSTLEGTLFYRNVGVGDSGATLSSALGANRRWTMGGLYVPGPSVTGIKTATNINAGNTTPIVLPGPTGTTGGTTYWWFAIGVHRNTTSADSVSGIGTGTTAGWTERLDVSNSGASPFYLIWAASKDASVTGDQSDITLNAAVANSGVKQSYGILLVDPGATTVTGTVAATEGGDTSSASGAEVFTGTASPTQGADTSSATGAETLAGSAAVTQAADTSSVTAIEVSVGTVGVTAGADTSTASGTVTPPTVVGTASPTEGGDTASAAGTAGGPPVTGSAAVAQAPDTASTSGAVGAVSWFRAPTVKRIAGVRRLYDLYTLDKGVSVVKVDGHYRRYAIPPSEALVGLREGVDYFIGGRAAVTVSDTVAAQLVADGFTVYDHNPD